MNKIFILLFIFVFPPSFSAKVIGVADGDTITVLVDKEQIKIRLNGIDCPEKSQDFGQVAKQFTADLAFGKEVTIIPHEKDRYGRTIADVILPDGRNLNQELVKAGLAWHYKKYSKDTLLATLELEAKTIKTGLWSQSHYIEPWTFRTKTRVSSTQNE